MNKKLTTKKIVMVALMAALTVAGSSLRIKVPASVVGTSAFHLGNIMCALSGILLGPWLGGLAAGLGSALYDMFDPMYIAEAWLTFLMKGAYGLVAGLIANSGKKAWGYGKSAVATTAGALLYAALYLGKTYLKGVYVKGLTSAASLLALTEKILPTSFNAVVAIAFAPILAVAIRTALEKNHLTLD